MHSGNLSQIIFQNMRLLVYYLICKMVSFTAFDYLFIFFAEKIQRQRN